MYYILILFSLLLIIYLPQHKGNLKKENVCLFLLCSILVVMAAFRSDMVGADTAAYRDDYLYLYQFKDFDDIVDRYTISYIGYYGLSKLFNIIGLPVFVWFAFVEVFYLYALMNLINRFSKDKIFSLLVFITIGLFSFSLAGLKQTMGASFVMLAFLSYIDKKYITTIVLSMITYYTHPACLIGLGALPLYNIRKTKWFIPLITIICFGIFFFSTVLMRSMVGILDNEHFESYLVNDTSYTYVTFIFYAVTTGIAFLNFKTYNSSEPEFAKLFLGLSTLGCGIQLLAGVSPSLFRLALLYTPFMTILLPNAAFYSKSNITKCILLGCLIFFFLYTNRNTPYSFI